MTTTHQPPDHPGIPPIGDHTIRDQRKPLCVLWTATLLMLSATANAFDIKMPRSPADIAPIEVSKNTFVLHGLPGLPTAYNRGLIANLGFVVAADGVVVVDSGSSGEHGELLATAISATTSKPVVAVFNTHEHGDHWLGNHALQTRWPKAKIYGHPKLIKKSAEGEGERWASLFRNLTDGKSGDSPVAPATHEAQDNASWNFGDLSVTVMHTGVAHTESDLLVHVTFDSGTSVAFLGDLAFNQRLGRLDDGSFRGNIEALERAMALNADVTVPGHGPSTRGDNAAAGYHAYLKTLYTLTEPLIEEGLSDFEIKEKIAPQFERWKNWGGFEEGFGRQVNLIYLEIEQAGF